MFGPETELEVEVEVDPMKVAGREATTAGIVFAFDERGESVIELGEQGCTGIAEVDIVQTGTKLEAAGEMIGLTVPPVNDATGFPTDFTALYPAFPVNMVPMTKGTNKRCKEGRPQLLRKALTALYVNLSLLGGFDTSTNTGRDGDEAERIGGESSGRGLQGKETSGETAGRDLD